LDQFSGDELREYIESEDYGTERESISESLRLQREKQTVSPLHALLDLLAEGLGSGEPVEWGKLPFLKKPK